MAMSAWLYIIGYRDLRGALDVVSMAGLARETETIELVILVSPITFRHPAVLVKNAATIQETAILISSCRSNLDATPGWSPRNPTRRSTG